MGVESAVVAEAPASVETLSHCESCSQIENLKLKCQTTLCTHSASLLSPDSTASNPQVSILTHRFTNQFQLKPPFPPEPQPPKLILG